MGNVTVTSSAIRTEASRSRRVAFYAAVGLTLAAMAITGPLLTLPVTAWFPEQLLDALLGEQGLGIHRVHMQGATMVFWLTIVAMVAQLRNPTRKAGPVWAAALAWVVFLPLELTHLVDPYSVMVTVLVVAVLILHPRRWPQTPLAWQAGSGLLAIPWAVVAIAYAYGQATLQVNGMAADPHVSGSHYALMAGMAVGLAASALLGATTFPGSLVSAWTAGVMAVGLGVFSIGHPDQASSVGVGWGSAIVIWGLAFLFISSTAARRTPATLRPTATT